METQKMNENTELEKIVTESGLQLNDGEQIKQSYLPFFEQLAEIKESATKINFENPTPLDEEIAKKLRLATVKIRTGSEQVKNERKRIHTLRANVEQTAWNLIKSTCQLEEEHFLQVEKKREFAEKLRIENLTKERTTVLSELVENASLYPLGTMTDEAFNELVEALKLAKQAKIDAEAKAEQERIEAKRLEDERIENQRLENERLKKEAEERERLAKIERDKQAKLLADAQAKADAEKKKQDEILAKQKAESEAKLQKEREAKKKLEDELKAKADAELAEKKRLEAIEKKRIADEKKAAKAPIKDKLTLAISTLELSLPESEVTPEIQDKFNGFKSWAMAKIETL